MPCREIIILYFENLLYGQNLKLFSAKADGSYNEHCALKDVNGVSILWGRKVNNSVLKYGHVRN
jgi:hypothetical protein